MHKVNFSNSGKIYTFKRLFSVLLSVLMLLTIFPSALISSAFKNGEEVTVSGVKDYVNGFYYNWNGEFDLGHKYGQYQKLTADGQVAYCVEPSAHLSAGKKTITDEWKGLTSEQRSLITYAFIYGYNGTNKYGYSNEAERAGTQAVIWAIAVGAFNTGSEQTLFNCVFDSSKMSSANINAGIAMYNAVKTQILLHRTIPSFSTNRESLVGNKNIVLKYDAADKVYKTSIQDENHVNGYYSFSMDGVNFEKEGDWLTISTSNEYKGATVTGRRVSNVYSDNLPAIVGIYCVGTDQTTATAMNRNDPVNAFFSITTEGRGTLCVVKTAEDGDALGTKFLISGPSGTCTATIDTDYGVDERGNKRGYLALYDLIPGDYTVTELNVPDKYCVWNYLNPNLPWQASDTRTYYVAPGNDWSLVNFYNQLKKGSLVINKSSEDGQKAGWKFRVQGTALNGTKIDRTETTNADGKVVLNNLLAGTYSVTETNCPSYMVAPSNQDIVIQSDTVTNITFTNNYKKGSVVLTKTDADTNAEIISADGEFEVLTWSEAQQKYVHYSWLEYSNNLDKNVFGKTSGYFRSEMPITADNGGKYRVVEHKAPTGYYNENKSYDFTLTDNLQVYDVNNGAVTNTLQKAKITISKTDKETGKAVAGATYGVYAKNDIVANGVTIYRSGAQITTVTTGKDGKATTEELYLGDYIVKETVATDGYVLDKTEYPVSLEYKGQDVNVYTQTKDVTDMPQKATITVTKTDAETNSLIVDSAKYGVYAKDDIIVNGEVKFKANQLVDTITTKNGKGTSKELYLGNYYVKELEAPTGYVINSNTYFVPLLYHGQNTTVFNFNIDDKDVPQKATITVTKTDVETDKPLSYAKYGVYAAEDIVVNGDVKFKKGALVDTITTDIKGVAVSSALYLGKYTVIEQTASVGYVIDKTEYPVSLEYKGQEVTIYDRELNVTDMPQKGSVIIHKSDPETHKAIAGAVYEITAAEDVIVNGDVKYKKGSLVETVTTDATGTATSKLLYLGNYKVTEKSAPKPFVKDTTVYDVALTYQGQSISTFVSHLYVTDLAQKANIKLIKTDIETGKPLANAIYKVISADDIIVNGEVKFKKGALVDTITTDINGVAVSSALYLGKYTVIEQTASDGYVIDKTEYPVSLEYKGQEVTIYDRELNVTDMPQKAIMHITKQGEVLSGFTTEKTEYGTKYTPVYTVQNLANAVYEIYAAEDIIVNGDVKFKKGALVDTITTEMDGVASSSALYLGKYYYVEKTAPIGFAVNTEKHNFSLTYQGQNITIFDNYDTVKNERQKFTLEFTKTIEENTQYPNPNAYKDVLFGVYSTEDIYVEDKLVMPKGSLIDLISLDKNKKGVSSVDFPLGSYYLKEIKTAEGLKLNTTEYPFVLSAQEQTILSYTYDLNADGTEIENNVLRGKVSFTKGSTFEGDYRLFADATYGVYRTVDDYLVETITTDKNGFGISSSLPFGNYYLKEITPPPRYTIDDTKYPFSIDEKTAGDTIVMQLKDAPIIGSLVVSYTEPGGTDYTDIVTSPVIPKTGLKAPYIMSAAAFLFVSSMAATAKIKRKKIK